MLPHQLNRVLEMSVANTANSGNNGSNVNQLSEEDKRFLSGAFESLCPDYVKILKDCLAVLDKRQDAMALTATESTHNQKVAAFQELLNHCDNLDVARDFEKLGGFRVISYYIDNVFKLNDEMVLKEGILAMDVLSMCCQLNDYCQDRAIQGSLLLRSECLLDESLQKILSASFPLNAPLAIAPLRVAFKALAVLSAIVRGNEMSISSYLHIENGKCLDDKATKKSMTLLVNALDIGGMKIAFDGEKYDEAERALPRRIRTKAAFLLRSLVNKEESAITASNNTSVSPCSAAMDVAIQVGAVEKLGGIITNSQPGSESTDYEHILSLLAWLCEQSVDARTRLCLCMSQIAYQQLLDWKETAKEDDDAEIMQICDKIMSFVKK